METLLKKLLCASALLLSTAAQADIVGYDITNAELTGFGNWSHDYFGDIVKQSNGLYNYSNGHGTLNDKVIATDYLNNQLFAFADNSTITLHLDKAITIKSINLFGGNVGDTNYIPGALTGLTVTIGGVAVNLKSTDFGPQCQQNLCNDSLSLANTALASVVTNTITLSNFVGTPPALKGTGPIWYNATEITVIDGVAPVPEPGTYAMLAAGLGLLGFAARRQRRS